jgi:hypothetical protein
MAQLTKDKISEIFCIADDFCKKYEEEIKKRLVENNDGKQHRNRSYTMSDSEIITIMICFHYGQFRNFKHFYLYYVAVHLKGEFPNIVSYNRFVELERKVAMALVLFIKMCCTGSCTGIAFIDSTKIAVCNNKRIKRNKVFNDLAKVGKSSMGWFYGFKLHLVVNDKGEILNFAISPANVDDRDLRIINPLCKEIFGKLYGDKGYISTALTELLYNDGLHLVTGIKNNMKNQLMPMSDKIMLRKRSVIETINDILKNVCQIEHSRHRSPANFLINFLAALATYSFFEKKPAIKYEVNKNCRQLTLFS